MRSFKSLIVPLIIMVVLVVGVIVYFAVSSSSKEPIQSQSVELFSAGYADLDSISVKSKDPASPLISVLVKTSDGVAVDFEYNGEDKDPKASYSSYKMSSFVSALMYYYADLISDNVVLSEYGLQDPEYKIILTKKNGETSVVNMGDLTTDGSNVYVSLEGTTGVYTVPAIKKEYAAYKGNDFLESQILDLDYSLMESVSFTRKTDGLELKADVKASESSDAPQFRITSPIEKDSSSNFATLMDYVAKLRIMSYVDIPAEELGNYGLADPAFVFTFANKDGSTKKISLSMNMAGYYYGFIDSNKEYFKLSGNEIGLLDAPVLSYMQSYVKYFRASDISVVKGEYKDESFEFSLDVKEDEAISDKTATALLNGRNAQVTNNEGRSYCAMFFESLVCMDIGGLELDAKPVLNDPVCNLTFITSNYQTYLVEFVKRNNDSYYVFINGEYSGYYVYDKVLFNNGGTDTYSYGVWEAYKLLNTAISENRSGVYNIPVDQ